MAWRLSISKLNLPASWLHLWQSMLSDAQLSVFDRPCIFKALGDVLSPLPPQFTPRMLPRILTPLDQARNRCSIQHSSKATQGRTQSFGSIIPLWNVQSPCGLESKGAGRRSRMQIKETPDSSEGHSQVGGHLP